MKFIFLWSFRKETLPCMLSLHLPIYKKTSSFMLNKKCNCSGVPTFKSQREGHQSNQKLLHSLSTLSASLSALKGHIFHKAHPKSWNWLFAFLNLYQLAKNQLIPSVQFWYSQFQSAKRQLATLIYNHAQPKNFQ